MAGEKSSTPEVGESGLSRGLAWALLGVLALLAIGAFHDSFLDDAFITFRYGQNLALGRGPVFNVGEAHLGTTSPGEMFVSALAYSLVGRDATPHVMSGLGVLAWFLQAPLLYLLIARESSRFIGYAVAASICVGLALSHVFVSLETNTALALTFASMLAAQRGRWHLAMAAGACAGFFRPDAHLANLMLCAVLIHERRARAVGPLATFAGFTLPWALYATWFFGSPVPMTLAAKFHRTPPLEYARHVLSYFSHAILPFEVDARTQGFASLLVVLLVILGGVHLARRGRGSALLVGYGFANLAAYLYLRPFVGHDWHFHPAVTVAVAAVASGVAAVVSTSRGAVRVACALLALALLAGSATRTVRRAVSHATDRWDGARTSAYVAVAGYLRGRARAAPTPGRFAAVEVGTVAYYSDLPAFDLGGLVSKRDDLHRGPPVRWVVVDAAYLRYAPPGAADFKVGAPTFPVFVFTLGSHVRMTAGPER